jgi:hypothetical protein
MHACRSPSDARSAGATVVDLDQFVIERLPTALARGNGICFLALACFRSQISAPCKLDAVTEKVLAPLACAAEGLDEITGIGSSAPLSLSA